MDGAGKEVLVEDDVSTDEDEVPLANVVRPAPNFVDDEDSGYFPDTVPRQCTDVIWIPLYLVCIAILARVTLPPMLYAPDVSPAVMDYQGVPCGSGVNVNKPFLYFCLSDTTSQEYLMDNKYLNVEFPLCIEQCPTSYSETIDCYQGKGLYKKIRTYDSFVLGEYCTPMVGTAGNHIFWDQLGFWLKTRPRIVLVAIFYRARYIFSTIGAMTAVSASIYIMAVSRFASYLVWTGLIILVVYPGSVGMLMAFCADHSDMCPTFPSMIGKEKYMGYALIGLSAVLVICTCMARDNIEKAVVCMHWSCKCIEGVPSIKLEPIVRIVWLTLIVAFHGFAVASMYRQWLETTRDDDIAQSKWHELMKEDHENVYAVVFNPEKWCLVMFVLFMGAWNMMVALCVNHFAALYACQTWFFAGGMHKDTYKQPRCPTIFHGYCIALRYHLGSLIFAALVTMLVDPVRRLLLVIAGLVEDPSNPVGFILSGCCGCLVDFYYNYFDGLSEHSLYDLVLQATPWCQCVGHSTTIMNAEGSVGKILKGATWLFEMAGVGTFAFIGFYLSQLIIWKVETYHDPLSHEFISAPTVACAISSLIGVMASFPFMHLFRLVSDTILYARTVEKQRSWPNPNEQDGQGQSGGCTDDLSSAFAELLCMHGEVRAPPIHRVDVEEA